MSPGKHTALHTHVYTELDDQNEALDLFRDYATKQCLGKLKTQAGVYRFRPVLFLKSQNKWLFVNILSGAR